MMFLGNGGGNDDTGGIWACFHAMLLERSMDDLANPYCYLCSPRREC